MKKVLLTIITALFIFTGCQDDNSILQPSEDNLQASSSEKGRVILPKYITLPEDGTLAKTIESTDSWYVEGFFPADEDNSIIVNREYKGGIYGLVKVNVVLKIYKGTFKKDAYVAMYVNDENGTVTFKASQVLTQPAELYVKYEGIDLKEAVEPEIDFVFAPQYGTIESVNRKEIKYDLAKGELQLTAGLVSQFTQYGFVIAK
jgi:hypothetical protein